MTKELLSSFNEERKEPVIYRIFKLVDRYPSRSKAAEAWGINLNTLQNYYKRRDITPTPRMALLKKIAECENVSLEWLLTGEGNGPDFIELKNKKNDFRGVREDFMSAPKSATNEYDMKLAELFSVLSLEEKEKLVNLLMRKGVEIVLSLTDSLSLQLLQFPTEEKERLLALHEAKKGASSDSEANKLTTPAQKHAG